MAGGKTWQSKMQRAGTDNVAPPSTADLPKMSSSMGSFMGKSMAPGGGGRFAKMKSAIMAKGMSAGSAAAIAASAGRKKYGAAKFAKMSAAGRRRG